MKMLEKRSNDYITLEKNCMDEKSLCFIGYLNFLVDVLYQINLHGIYRRNTN